MSARGPGPTLKSGLPAAARIGRGVFPVPGCLKASPSMPERRTNLLHALGTNPPARAGIGKGSGKLVGLRAVELAVALFMWAVGSAFGALGLSSFEGGERERGERYLLYMAYFWFVALAAMVSSSVLSGRAVLVLACLAAVFFGGAVVVPGRLLSRSMREEDLGTMRRRLWRR